MIERLKKLPLFRFFFDLPGVSTLYHLSLAFLGALIYGFPSEKLRVIGVTGTKGKTTVCNLISQIFEAAGYRTGLATTVNFKIGDTEWTNDTKQTMPGRFQLQKLLSDMVRAGCKYAIIETSSEGILQYRHRFIDYDAAVFTNITPEHIERHGSFEKYRDAKIKLFKQVAKKSGGVGVYNLDDPNVGYFLEPPVSNKYGYTLKDSSPETRFTLVKRLDIRHVELAAGKTSFEADGEKFIMPLVGEFNIYNAAAAICAAVSENIPMDKIRKALLNTKAPPGRLEIIDGDGFKVILDYAHEPASLEAVYKAARLFKPKRMIGVLGAQGGGRDKWKRAEMGKIAAKYCDEIILTNEDPYDENPEAILEDIASGFSQTLNSKSKILNSYKILDRREAINKAISLTRNGDVFILTGKGGEVWMCVEGGKKIPWSDKQVVQEILESGPRKK